MLKNKEVAEAFYMRKSASNRNMTSTGDKLFSYHTCIAQDMSDYGVIGNSTKYSKTTSTHLNYIRKYVTVWTTREVPRGTQSLTNYI